LRCASGSGRAAALGGGVPRRFGTRRILALDVDTGTGCQ
jgi:hypothetical protein